MERKYTVSVHEQIIQWFNMPYIPVYKLTFKDLCKYGKYGKYAYSDTFQVT